MTRGSRLLLSMALGGVLLFCGWRGQAGAQSVPQSFQSDQTLQKGLIVRLQKSNGNRVEALKQVDAANMLGVVVTTGDAPVSLSNTDDSNQTLVASSGEYQVLVSTQDGVINAGDYVTISSLTGVGMKANAKQTVVLGKALSSFDGKSATESTATLKDSSGGKQSVAIGRVYVDITVAHNPLYEAPAPSGVPKALSRAAQIVTDQPVGALRIYASLAVLAITIVIAGSILYAGVRSGMTAIGRNPLARRSISRNLLTVIISALIVFGVGLTAIYLILRL